MKKPLVLVTSMLVGVSTLFMPVLTAHADSSPTITEYPSENVPFGITTGPDGNIWYTEFSGNNIARITPSGTITEYPIPTQNAEARDITVGPDGALWFTEQGSNKIGRITTAGAITEYALPSPTANYSPYDIVAGPDGALWFTEFDTQQIGRITTSGVVSEYYVGLNSPTGITVGPDGALWFGEYFGPYGSGGNNIGRITMSGEVTQYPIPTADSYPTSITTGQDGALWFTELLGNKIGRITTSGDFTEYPIATVSAEPIEITAGPDGALWFTESNGNNVGRITTTGTITEYPVPTTYAEPGHITTGPDGNIWFTEESGNVGRVNLSAPTPVIAQAIDAGGTGSGDFVADADFSGGTSYTSTAAVDTSQVVNPAPQEVYQTARYGNNFSYTIPNLTPNANYTLDLDFNELYWGTSLANGGGVGSRVFNVSVNGTLDLTNFDVYNTAGGANKAIREQFPATADANGNVTIQFTSDTDNAMVSGIELYDGTLPALPTPPPPATVSSAYIAAGGSAVGNFVADTDFLGGTPYSSSAAVDTSGVANPAPEAVYQNARYGNFTYSVPNLAPNTNYNVQLDFNELYWGTSLASGVGGVGSRVFNVAINGTQVLTNFDIYATAGGANKAVAQNFTATSDANGTITVQFSSLLDNAMVSGIEVTQAQ